MLIRSQDKKILANINGYAICVVGGEIRLTNQANSYLVLGNYSTEEKALEVLDLIEMDYMANCKICNMPQEDELCLDKVTETERELAEVTNVLNNYKSMLFGE